MPPRSGTSTNPKTPTASTRGIPSASRPRARPHQALTTSAAPTSASTRAASTPRSRSIAPLASSTHAAPTSTSTRLAVTAPRYDRGAAGAGGSIAMVGAGRSSPLATAGDGGGAGGAADGGADGGVDGGAGGAVSPSSRIRNQR